MVVTGLAPLDPQAGPQAIGDLWQRPAAAQPFGPWGLLSALATPDPAAVAARPRMTAGSAARIAASLARRSWRPGTAATGQTAVAAGPAAQSLRQPSDLGPRLLAGGPIALPPSVVRSLVSGLCTSAGGSSTLPQTPSDRAPINWPSTGV